MGVVVSSDLVTDAHATARALLGSTSARWRHVVGVARAASLSSAAVAPDEADLLVAAAWLHDIGYADPIAGTGFHPLDGARYLRDRGADPRLCRLVANHTAASFEAVGRGLSEPLAAEFPTEVSPVADALTYADMTTGPTGLTVTVRERLAEILIRYPPGHVVHESIRAATPTIHATMRRVQARLGDSQPR